VRYFAIKTIEMPKMGDSITEGQIGKWNKKIGDFVTVDEIVA